MPLRPSIIAAMDSPSNSTGGELARHDPTLLAYACRDTRRAFGYDYRVAEYADPSLRWQEIAPWVYHSVVPAAHNAMEATLRELGPRMPVHDLPASAREFGADDHAR